METIKIKFKKTIFDLVKTIGNDMELGKQVRLATNEYQKLKKEKEEKTKKTKLPKVKKENIDNYSKNSSKKEKKNKLKPMPEL